MKRAFDSNVSRAKPRTRMLEAFAPEPEGKISADLAAIIAKPGRAGMPERTPERSRGEAATRVARTQADLAGAAAGGAVRVDAVPVRKDSLLATEEKLALQASEAAHATSRAGMAPAEAVRHETRVNASPTERVLAARQEAPRAPAADASQARSDGRMTGVSEGTSAARPDVRAAASERAPARPLPETRSAPTETVASADLAATVRQDLRSAARPAPRTEAAPRVEALGISDDLGRTMARAHAARGRMAAPAGETVREGRARIEELRGKLRAVEVTNPAPEAMQPAGAAAAVRLAVADLRARLAAAVVERDDLARTLESTRDDLRRVGQELSAKSRELEAARDLAQERARVAEELAAEGDALAEERDRALARILELKALDEQQTRLLEDAQEALAERDRRLGEGAAEVRELVGLIDAQAVEIEDLHARLAQRSGEVERSAARIAALEADLQKLVGTREALSEIQRLIAAAD